MERRGIVIVGGGLAGVTAATALRQRAFEDRIVVLCDEHELPYDRPPLSKGYLFAAEPLARLPVPDDVELRLGDAAYDVDLSAQVVRSSSGKHAYDHLLLATGSHARSLTIEGTGLDGVHRLRTANDAARLQHDTTWARDVVIVGGGLIGSELASGFVSAGAAVTVIDPDPMPLARALGADAAQIMQARMRDAGVRIVRGSVDALEGKGRVSSAIVNGSSVLADLVVIAIGATPNVELACQAGLDVGSGIICDAHGRASAPNVYAAGDIAQWPYAVAGSVRFEHWRGAVDQAGVVAAAILGDASTLPPPWMWTEQFGARVESAGMPHLAKRTAVDTSITGEVYVECFLGQRLIGVAGIDCPRRVRRAMTQLLLSDREPPVP